MRGITALNTCLIAAAAGTTLADPQDGDLFDGIVTSPNERASFKAFIGGFGVTEVEAFEGDPVSVRNGSLDNPIVAGERTTGSFDILVGWEEFFDNANPGEGVASRIRFVIETSDGSPFLTDADAAANRNVIRWEIGDHSDPDDDLFADPIDFRPFVSDLTLLEATAVLFTDDNTENSIPFGFTLPSDWDGTDAVLSNTFTLGPTTNRIEITYDYLPVPTPASGLVLGSLVLGGMKRRRR
ncbi:MAG: hypothetical protein AAGB48_04150 [Planctomycetota bacterium]